MKSIRAKLSSFELRKATENTLLIVSLLLLFDAAGAVFGHSYLSRLGNSTPIILSNLLFLEGSVIFALGTFIAVAIAMMRTKPPESSPEEPVSKQTRKKRVPPALVMAIIGMILIGLSIVVGTLLL